MKPIQLEIKTYEELKEELGNEYDTAMYKINVSALKEIERLNNIINELEKWLNNEIKRLDEMQGTYDKYGKKKDANIIYISGAYNEVLDKLQELTGEDKE